MVEESGVVPTRQETTCKIGLRLIGRLGDGSKWVVDGRWVALMLKGKERKEKDRNGEVRRGPERKGKGKGWKRKERKGKGKVRGWWRRIVSWLLVPSVAVLVVEATHLCVKGLHDVERESIPWPLSLLCWSYVGSCVRGTSGGVMLLLVRRAKLRSIV